MGFKQVAVIPQTKMKMSSIFKQILFFQIVLLLSSCGNSGLDGEYQGQIGTKQNVTLRFSTPEKAELSGYWVEKLSGIYEKASIKGKSVDSFVFMGPEQKAFKLRICYEKKAGHLEILAIHSRMIGPGARYIPTEPESTFAHQKPKLYKLD
jgi:hypothetical protein